MYSHMMQKKNMGNIIENGDRGVSNMGAGKF